MKRLSDTLTKAADFTGAVRDILSAKTTEARTELKQNISSTLVKDATVKKEDIQEAKVNIIDNIANSMEGVNLVDARKYLEGIFSKKNVTSAMSPVMHFRIRHAGKTIILVNKKYADDPEKIVGDIAIGFEGKV